MVSDCSAFAFGQRMRTGAAATFFTELTRRRMRGIVALDRNPVYWERRDEPPN